MDRKALYPKLCDSPKSYEKTFHNRSQSVIPKKAAPRPIKRKTVLPSQSDQLKPNLKSCLKKSDNMSASSDFQNKVEKFIALSSRTRLESKISTNLAVSNKLKETDNIIEQLCSLDSPLNNCPQKLLSYLEEIKNDLQENCNQIIKKQVSKINTIQDCEDKMRSAPTLEIIHKSSDIIRILQSLCDEQIIKTFLQERGKQYSNPCNPDYESHFQTGSSNQPSLTGKYSAGDVKLLHNVSRVSTPMNNVHENQLNKLIDLKNEPDKNTNTLNDKKEVTTEIPNPNPNCHKIPYNDTNFQDNQTDATLPKDKIKVLEYFIAKEIEKCDSRDSIKPELEKSLNNKVQKSESQSSTDTLTLNFSISTLSKDVESRASNSISFKTTKLKNENYNKNINDKRWTILQGQSTLYTPTDCISTYNDQNHKNNLGNVEVYNSEKINVIDNKKSLPLISGSSDVNAYKIKLQDSSSTFIENAKLDYKLKRFPKIYPDFVTPVSENLKKYDFNDNLYPKLKCATEDTLSNNSKHLEDEINKLKFLVSQEMIRKKYPYHSLTKFDDNSNGPAFERPSNAQVKYFRETTPEYTLSTSSDASSLSCNSSLTPSSANNFPLKNLEETKSWTSTGDIFSKIFQNEAKNQVQKNSNSINLLDKFIRDLDSKEVKNVRSVEMLLKNIEKKENELKTRCKFAKNIYQNFLTNKMKVVKTITEIKSSKFYAQNKKLIEHLNLMDLDLLESTLCMILDSKKLSEMAEDCKKIILINKNVDFPVPQKKSRKRSSYSVHSNKHHSNHSIVLDSNNSSKPPNCASKSYIPLFISCSCQDFGESSAVVPDNFELVACNEYPSKIAGITVLKNVLYVVLEDRRELYYSPLNDFRGNKLFWSRKYTSLVDPLDMISNGEFLFILLANGRMLKIDPNRNNSIEKVMRLPLGLGDDAISLSQLRSGNFLVINRSPGQIIELDVNSKVVKVINLANKLDDISHVLQLSSQRFVVSCSGYSNRGVCLIDAKGEIISKSPVDLKSYEDMQSINYRLCLTNILKCPLHLAADTTGLIYVADSSKNCIVTLSANLECVSKVYFSKFPFSQPTRLYYHPKSKKIHFSCLSKNKWVVGSFKTSATLES